MGNYFPPSARGRKEEKAQADSARSPAILGTMGVHESFCLAHRILSQFGYRVLAAGNGEEAMVLAQKHEGPIHLLVSDVVMPGLNGRQPADRFSHIRPEAKVLFTSGYTEDVIIHRGVLEDGIAFLIKPYTPRILGTKVREILDGHVPAPAG